MPAPSAEDPPRRKPGAASARTTQAETCGETCSENMFPLPDSGSETNPRETQSISAFRSSKVLVKSLLAALPVSSPQRFPHSS